MNPPQRTAAGRKSSRLWLWFVGAFVLQAAVWATWITIAAQHKVQEVPLAGAGSYKR